MANLFNYDVNLQPAVMDIRSETLEPISSSTMRYVFRLDQAGELDSNSVLLFKPLLAANDANREHNQRVNPWGGGLLAIKRAIFQVGDYILNDIQDVGRISNLVDMGTINSSNNSKYNGHYFKNNTQFKVLESGGTDGVNLAGGTESQAGGAGTIVYDRNRSGMDFGIVHNNAVQGKVNNCVITNNVDTNHQIGIPLGNLFPCLKGQNIPLFLFQDYRILITIEFATCENWVNMAHKGTNHHSQISIAGDVVPTEVKLQVDYIINPSEIQNKQREMTNAQGGLNLAFPDIIKVEKQIAAAGANDAANSGLTQNVEHRIGMDNKEVHSIYMLKKIDRNNPSNYDKIFLNARCDGMDVEEYNVNIDGVDVFQEAKWNPSSQYDELTNCLGDNLKVPRPVFFNDCNTYMSRLADATGGLLGKLKPLCLDLKNGNGGVVGGGRSIGAYPIIWKYQRKPTARVLNKAGAGNEAGELVGRLNDALSVDYFVYCSRTANITSTPSGTSVMVAY